MDADRTDIVVIGGGMTGCMAALMYRQRGYSVSVFESRTAGEPQRFVVGEALTEGTSVFLRHELGMSAWLMANAYRKFGFDFLIQPRYAGAPEGPHPDECHELLMSLVPFEKMPGAFRRLIPTFHVDRTLLDAELCRRAIEAGATVHHETKVIRVELGARDHVVHVSGPEGERTVHATWVLDCSGWKGLLSKQLGMRKRVEALPTASVWNRFKGVDASPETFQTFGGIDRRRQTIHFAGEGFWIWWIHQRDGLTSVGVTYDTRQHQPDRQPADRGFWEMIQKFPAVARALEGAEALEPFQAYGHLPHGSDHWVSANGYAILGDAGWFVDPLYSVGIETSARQLMALVPLLEGTRHGQPADEAEVDRLNEEYRHLQAGVLELNRFKYEEAWHRPHTLFQVVLYELGEIAELYHMQDVRQWRPEVLAKHYRLQWGSSARVSALKRFLDEARKDADRDRTLTAPIRKALSPTRRVYAVTWPLFALPGMTPWFFELTRAWGFLERWGQRVGFDLLALQTRAMPPKLRRDSGAPRAAHAGP